MIIREALSLTALGMGIVFLVLAIDYFSIFVIRMFEKDEQTDLGVTRQNVALEFIVGKKQVSTMALESGHAIHGEIEAAIMAAICAWEAQEEKNQDYL